MSSAFYFNPPAARPSGTRHVVACVGNSDNAAKITAHAYAIAEALGVPVTLLQVLEAKPAQTMRPDPIEWDLRRREARSLLRRLAENPDVAVDLAGIQLAEGSVANEIIRFTNGRRDNLLVLGTQGEHIAGKHCIGGTVHDVLERATDSVLLVPTTADATRTSYDRIVIPLDGSPWAESVMPLAVRVAQSMGAELVLIHVVPAPELTEPRPLEPEDMELRRRVIERNERAAGDYLDRLRGRLTAQGLHVRVVLKHGENVCTSLAQAVAAEAADLVIMSARGHGACQHGDVSYGNVASFLMTHTTMPLLIAHSHTAMPKPEAAVVANHQFSRMPVAGPA